MAKLCKQAVVSGKVQGVFYRASTREQARSLGVTGYAKNMPDGSVEVLACGGEDEVARLLKWMRQGPPASNVTRVEIQDVHLREVEGFEVL